MSLRPLKRAAAAAALTLALSLLCATVQAGSPPSPTDVPHPLPPASGNKAQYPDTGWAAPILGTLKAGPAVLPADFDTGVPPPPPNESEQTKAELATMLKMQEEERTPESIDLILYDHTMQHILQGFQKRGVFDPMKHPATIALVDSTMRDMVYFLIRDKMKYKRVRPTQLEDRLTTVITIPGHASYPSGHAGQAISAAMLLGMVDPAHKDDYDAAALSIARGREVAGVHYPSDKEASRILAEHIIPELLKNPTVHAYFLAAKREYGK